MPPRAERKHPDTFCWTFSIRRSCSAWLLSKGMRRSSRNASTSSRLSQRRSRRLRAGAARPRRVSPPVARCPRDGRSAHPASSRSGAADSWSCEPVHRSRVACCYCGYPSPDGLVTPVLAWPAEHLWPLTNSVLINQHFATIDDLEEVQLARCAALQHQSAMIRSATCFHWWPRQIHKRRGPRTR